MPACRRRVRVRPASSATSCSRVRTLGLTGRLEPALLGDYLSGLLIGHELLAGLAAHRRDGAAPLVLVGDPALCRRYATALEPFGVARRCRARRTPRRAGCGPLPAPPACSTQ